MEVMRAAALREAAGHHVLHLEVGQPSIAAPVAVRRAAAAALESDVLGYTTALGTPELRAAIAGWYQQRFGLTVEPANVIATTGASGSCVLAFLAMFDPGDRVAVLEPGYPCYRNDLLAFGVDAVGVPVGPETDYRPTIERLEAAGPLRGLVLASPSNPTGTVIPPEELAQILDWARTAGVEVIVDEIYSGIEYHGRPPATALQWVHERGADNVSVFNSFSKYWAMTGWRLGWIVAPDHLVEPIERLAQNLTIAPPTLSQIAGVAAFEAIDECEAAVADYAVNRRLVLDGLIEAGLDAMAPPDGAFYVWVDVASRLGGGLPDARALCTHWLETLGVAVTPGIDFDPVRGDRFIRISYARSASDIGEAIDRIAAWSNR